MTTEDLTKRLRLVESLVRERQYEFALTLVERLDEAISMLPADAGRCVPNSVRDTVESLRSAARSGSR